MWQKYINREFMGTSLAGEGEKNCVRPISTSLVEGRKWLNFVVLHREIGIKRACVLIWVKSVRGAACCKTIRIRSCTGCKVKTHVSIDIFLLSKFCILHNQTIILMELRSVTLHHIFAGPFYFVKGLNCDENVLLFFSADSTCKMVSSCSGL